MPTPSKDRIEELEGQIRDELDRRISIQVSEFRKRAATLFKDEQHELFSQYLNNILTDPACIDSEEFDEIIKVLKSDQKAQAIFTKLQDILRLKEMAIEVSEIDGPADANKGKVKPRLNRSQETIFLPSSMPVIQKKGINTPNDLREAITDTTKGLTNVIPDPANWLGWLICWLESLDKEAQSLELETEYEEVLERLMDMVSNRLYNKKW